MHRYILFILSVNLIFSLGCKKDKEDTDPSDGLIYIEPSTQVSTGNVAAGYDFLRYGNFIGGGIPYNVFTQFFGQDNSNLLGRTAPNDVIPRNFNAYYVDTVLAVGGITCFGCHSASIDGQFILGLGNSFSDFTDDNTGSFVLANALINDQYGANSPEAITFAPLFRGASASASDIVTPFAGVNPAFILEQSVVAHRDPVSVAWLPQNYFDVTAGLTASDVPPLWNVKKKHALYYNGMGRGDFTKLLMQVTLVGITDSAEAHRIHDNFDDVLAWIEQLQPPAYPKAIDQNLAAEGQTIFTNNCARCHGVYGSVESYPNLLVSQSEVGTDPVYANYFFFVTNFANWFNASWLGNVNGDARLQPSSGYVAPPLDGIWATAPYLHNGSVPSLEDLLNSPQRPSFWRRSFTDTDYDWSRIGWNYTTETGPTDKNTYNTSISGYGNGGHTYGDGLTADERAKLIEYLKTL